MTWSQYMDSRTMDQIKADALKEINDMEAGGIITANHAQQLREGIEITPVSLTY